MFNIRTSKKYTFQSAHFALSASHLETIGNPSKDHQSLQNVFDNGRNCPNWTPQLASHTSYDQFSVFLAVISPHYMLELAKFLATMTISAFDTNQTGTIVWRQFMTDDVTDVDLKTRKLKWIFRLLDRDGDSIIQLKEIIQTFAHFYIIEDIDPRYLLTMSSILKF